jgi:HSP20 family protein
MNAWTTEDEEVVTAELPGINPNELEITIANEVLTISGERKPAENPDEVRYHRRERAAGKFTRSIQLSFPVDSEAVNAHYENGILTVTLPRTENDKPRKIAVKSL